MAETSWPTVAGARVVTDDQYEQMTANWSADGVYAPLTSTPVFGDSSGRQVKVRANIDAILGGHGYDSGTSDTIKSIGVNASGSTRYDAVVLGLDRTTWAVTSYVKAGTPGAGVPPALQRDARGSGAGKWEIPLAMVTVVNGAATIAAGDVKNIAWYSVGETVATVSDSLLLPPATDYARLRYTDLGYEFDSVAGAWRRSPWQVARGIIGGKRYTSGATLVAVGTSETLAGIDSGTVNLEANRRYRLHLHLRLGTSVGNNYFTARIRETNISGTIVLADNQLQVATGANHDWHFVNDITTSAAATKTYVATLSGSAGTTNSNAGSSTGLVGIMVEDLGPSSPNSVTTV